MDARKKGYRIGELAHLTEVNPRTIDFYTREGLLEALERSGSSQHRYYPSTAIDRLRLIKQLRARSMSLAQIRAYLDGLQQPERREVLQTLRSVCQQIDHLKQQLEDVGPVVAGSDRAMVLGMTAEAMQKMATLTAALMALLA
jgi:DNA-binding transcriptional MerR regulator